VLATGPGVFSSSGLDDKEATAAFIKRYKEAYRTDTIKQYVAGDRIVRQWVILAAKEHRLMPTTEGALDMKLDLSQMIDGFTGSEHSLPIQPLYKDVTQFVAKSRTFYTPTTLVAYGAPWSENYYFETTAKLHDDPKMRRFIPHELYDTMVRRRGQWFLPEEYGHQGIAKGVADVVRRRTRRSRQPRAVPGTRRALGDLEPAVGRPDAARNAARRDHLRRRGARAAEGCRLDRQGQARGSARARQESADRHPHTCRSSM
jgi:hypothetical protein